MLLSVYRFNVYDLRTKYDTVILETKMVFWCLQLMFPIIEIWNSSRCGLGASSALLITRAVSWKSLEASLWISSYF